MSRASTRFTEALLLLLMFFLFVSFCSTGWGVKGKTERINRTKPPNKSACKEAQGKISGKGRNKISKGTTLTKASATAKRLHLPAIGIHSSWPLLSLRAAVIQQLTSQKSQQKHFCFTAQGKGWVAATQFCPVNSMAAHTFGVSNRLNSGYPLALQPGKLI